MHDPSRDARRAVTNGRLLTFGLVGWALFVGLLWYEHRPHGPDVIPPETAKALDAAGLHEAKVSAAPPPSVIANTVKIPGAERIVYVKVAATATETVPPVVQSVAGNCVPGVAQLPNWRLRSGDLGMRDGAIDIRKVGRHAFVAFHATLTAQTPEGETTRAITPDADAWVSSKALGIPPRMGPTIRVTTLPTAEAGMYWTKGRVQYDATAGYDLDRGKWFIGGGMRF